MESVLIALTNSLLCESSPRWLVQMWIPSPETPTISHRYPTCKTELQVFNARPELTILIKSVWVIRFATLSLAIDSFDSTGTDGESFPVFQRALVHKIQFARSLSLNEKKNALWNNLQYKGASESQLNLRMDVRAWGLCFAERWTSLATWLRISCKWLLHCDFFQDVW